MTRNLKILGLALVAVFAMSAVVASMASAQTVTTLTSDGPVTLVTKNTGGNLENSLTAFGGQTTCPEANNRGHKANVTPHVLIPSGVSEVTVSPLYGLCSSFGFRSTVDMNGCDYTFDLKETVGIDTYRVTATVHCTGAATPVVTIFSSLANHEANKPFCEVEVTPKTDQAIQNIVARDTTNGTIDIFGTVEGLEAHKRSPTGSILCPSETTTAGILHVDVTAEGRNSVGGVTNVSISD